MWLVCQTLCLRLVFGPPLTRRSCARFRDEHANQGGHARPRRDTVKQNTSTNERTHAAPWRHICAPEGLGLIVSDRKGGVVCLLFTCCCVTIQVIKYRQMKAGACPGGGDWPSETDRLYLCEIGNERRDSIGQLEEKLRVLQVKLS